MRRFSPALTTVPSVVVPQAAPAALALNGIQNAACREAYARMVAGRVFLPCNTNALAVSPLLMVPRLPCRSVCTDVLQQCTGNDRNLITVLAGQPLNCSAQGVGRRLPGYDDFPVTASVFAIPVPPSE